MISGKGQMVGVAQRLCRHDFLGQIDGNDFVNFLVGCEDFKFADELQGLFAFG